jgi:hypothetical protein
MSDRVLFPLMGLVAVLMIALALVWPQGIGARSPWPFGHVPVQQTPAARAAQTRAGAPQPMLGLAPAAPSPSARPAQ